MYYGGHERKEFSTCTRLGPCYLRLPCNAREQSGVRALLDRSLSLLLDVAVSTPYLPRREICKLREKNLVL